MKYDPNAHHRHSIRLKEYDYSQSGFYFVTICVQHRECLFGSVFDNKMILNEVGVMIKKWYGELENKFQNVIYHAYRIMPNHFHSIIEITEMGAGVSLPEIVQWFKTMTTNEYVRKVKNSGWKPFDGRLWQRNYYEHIIRNEQAFEKISEYIIYNPSTWQDDDLFVP